MHEVSLGGINDFGKQKQLNKQKNYWSQKTQFFAINMKMFTQIFEW